MFGLFLLVIAFIAALPLIFITVLILYAAGEGDLTACIVARIRESVRNFLFMKIFVCGSICVGLGVSMRGLFF